MASGEPQSAGTNSYVAPPEGVQPLDEQLSQLKIAAKDKLNQFVDGSKQQLDATQNSPQAREAQDALKQDATATAQDASQSYDTALQQIGAARQQAQQKSNDTLLQVNQGKGALQQGIATIQNALAQGVAAANETLKQGAHAADTPETQAKGVQSGQAADQKGVTLLQSFTAVLSQTVLSMKEAFVGKSSTTNPTHSTPVTTNNTVTHPPAQTVAESIGQTAAALKDAVKETMYPPAAQPGNNVNPGLPADVPKKTSE